MISPLRLAIGTLRAPKLEAARAVAGGLLSTLRLDGLAFDGFQTWECDAPSGVAETPLDVETLVEGATRRAGNAFAAARDAGFAPHFGLGLEGGACRGPQGRLYLQSWACVTNGARDSLGAGPALELPQEIAERLLRGESLAQVIDEVAGVEDVRSREGTFGILTRGRLSRSAIFEAALICAFAPFDAPQHYAPRDSGR